MIELGDWNGLAEVLEGTIPLLIELGHETEAAEVWGAILASQEELEVPDILRVNRARGEEMLDKALGSSRTRLIEAGRDMGILPATRLVLSIFDGV
jgi:hypothetical protein